MKAPFLRDPAHSPNFPQTTIRCHSVPSVGATGSERVLLPRARDALLGETFRGNRQSRVTRSRRAQGFDPEAEPNRRGLESGTQNCRRGTTDQDFKGRPDRSTPTYRPQSGKSQKPLERLLRESEHWGRYLERS